MGIYYFIAVLGSLAASLGQIFLKKSAIGKKKNHLSGYLSLNFTTGAFMFCLSAGMGIYVLTKIEFSSFYSITAMNYFFISILSKLILNETIDIKKILGNLVIFIGILFYNI